MSVDATIATWKLGKTVTAIQKLLLLSLADRAGENGECWPGIKRIMKDTNLDRNTIVENRKILVKKGLIELTGEMMGKTKSVPVMRLTYINHREENLSPNEIPSSVENHTACLEVSGRENTTAKQYGNPYLEPKRTKEPKRENKYILFFESWNELAKENPVMKNISAQRKNDFKDAEKAIDKLLLFWEEIKTDPLYESLGISEETPMGYLLMKNVLKKAIQLDWWFLCKSDSLRTITMTLRRNNFEEALNILKQHNLP